MRRNQIERLSLIFIFFVFLFAQYGYAVPVSGRLSLIASAQSDTASEPALYTAKDHFPNYIQVRNERKGTLLEDADDFAQTVSNPPVIDLLRDGSYTSLKVKLPIESNLNLPDVFKVFEREYVRQTCFQKLRGITQKANTIDLLQFKDNKIAMGAARKRLTEIVRICIYNPRLVTDHFRTIFPLVVKTARGIFRIHRAANGQCVGSAEKGEGRGTSGDPYTFTRALTYKEMIANKNNDKYNGLHHNMGIFERARGKLGALLLAKIPALVHQKGSAAMIRIVDKIAEVIKGKSTKDLSVGDIGAIKKIFTDASSKDKRLMRTIMDHFKGLQVPYVNHRRDEDSGSESGSEDGSRPSTSKTSPIASRTRSKVKAKRNEQPPLKQGRRDERKE